MIFQIKKWFYSLELKLIEASNKRKAKKYAQALELEEITKKTNLVKKEVNKKNNLIAKHSWTKKTAIGIQSLQKHLPKVDLPSSRESKTSKDFGKDFFSDVPKL